MSTVRRSRLGEHKWYRVAGHLGCIMVFRHGPSPYYSTAQQTVIHGDYKVAVGHTAAKVSNALLEHCNALQRSRTAD